MLDFLANSKQDFKTLNPQAFKLANMETTTLSDRIEIILKEQGIRATELAVVADVSDSTITHWKNGATESMKAVNALMIQEKYGYTIEWIISGKGPKTVEEAKRIEAQKVIDQKIRDGELIDISGLPEAAKAVVQQTASLLIPRPAP